MASVETVDGESAASVSVVVPCYRTSSRIRVLVERVSDALSGWADWELILVVDGSPDDTWEWAAEAARSHPRVHAIDLMRNYGQHAALLAGVASAERSITVTMDDDLQHPPEEVRKLVDGLSAGLDLVYGVPTEEEHGLFRNAGSQAVKSSLEFVLGVRQGRIASAFRAFRTSLRTAFSEVNDPFVPLDVLLAWSTSRMSSVPVVMHKRQEGASSYRLSSLARHGLNLVTGYSIRPLHFVGALGLTTFAVSLVVLVGVLIGVLTARITEPGFPTIVGLLVLFAGLQLLSLGILGEYLARLHVRSMGKRGYAVREIVR